MKSNTEKTFNVLFEPIDQIEEIIFAAETYKKSLGIMVNNKQELESYSKLGFNMIAVGTEMNILSRSISQILK